MALIPTLGAQQRLDNPAAARRPPDFQYRRNRTLFESFKATPPPDGKQWLALPPTRALDLQRQTPSFVASWILPKHPSPQPYMALPFAWPVQYPAPRQVSFVAANVPLLTPVLNDMPPGEASITVPARVPQAGPFWTVNLLQSTLAPSTAAAPAVTYQLTPFDWPISRTPQPAVAFTVANIALLNVEAAPSPPPVDHSGETVLSNKKASGPYWSKKQWRELMALIAAEKAAKTRAKRAAPTLKVALDEAASAAAELRRVLVVAPRTLNSRASGLNSFAGRWILPSPRVRQVEV